MTLYDINLLLRPFVALVCLGVGFSATGVDLVKVFHLNQFRKPFKYIAGIAGALALAEWLMALS